MRRWSYARWSYISSICLSALLGISACGSSSDRPAPGEIALNSMFTAEFDLIDHNGKTATDERFEGKPMFIYFGFANCPDVCPAALGTMTATLDRLGAKADNIQPLFITVDPKRDTAERLRDHLAYDPRILGLTGSAEALSAAQDAMNVFAQEVPLPDSAIGYTMDHQSLFFLTDSEGTPLVALRDNLSPEDVAAIIEKRAF
ncbi:MAG: SCO family protein [Pseudomonadota bacterium]